jgi:hypothetical protein
LTFIYAQRSGHSLYHESASLTGTELRTAV